MFTADRNIVMSDPSAIEAVRRFNRFYTRYIGVVSENWQGASFSLVEARVIFEIANRTEPSATDIAADLNLKKSYLSRILTRLEDRGLIEKTKLVTDVRRKTLSLTGKGRSEFKKLDRIARDQVAKILGNVDSAEKTKLLDSMASIEKLLGKDGESDAAQSHVVIRQPKPGDYGWVIHSNGRLYADEYNWDIAYEEMVLQIVADFVKGFDPKKEHCWIAELGGQNVGCVFLVKHTEEIAKLRLLITEKKARGRGLGKLLVEQCTTFARQAGYKKIVLWTQSHLLAARGIYKKAGYVLIKSEPGHMFGHDMVSETWELKL